MIAGKTVSLCMVVYNSSELVKQAIESVKSIVDEVVIVDQGSDEEEAEILKSLADNYSRTTNKGNADYDRMYCYAIASKEYILALDADEKVYPETLANLERLLGLYDFDCCWFLFDNYVTFNDEKISLVDMLKDDPHPRFWRKFVPINGQPMATVQWSPEAHQMPRILSDRQIFSQSRFNHTRTLTQIIRTHLHRGKNINPQAREMEKSFVNAVLAKFPKPVTATMNGIFPELKEYLR